MVTNKAVTVPTLENAFLHPTMNGSFFTSTCSLGLKGTTRATATKSASAKGIANSKIAVRQSPKVEIAATEGLQINVAIFLKQQSHLRLCLSFQEDNYPLL